MKNILKLLLLAALLQGCSSLPTSREVKLCAYDSLRIWMMDYTATQNFCKEGPDKEDL